MSKLPTNFPKLPLVYYDTTINLDEKKIRLLSKPVGVALSVATAPQCNSTTKKNQLIWVHHFTSP